MDGGLTIETDDGTEPQLEWVDNEHSEIYVILGGDTMWRIIPIHNTYTLSPSRASLPSGPSITAISVNTNALDNNSGDDPNSGGGGNNDNGNG